MNEVSGEEEGTGPAVTSQSLFAAGASPPADDAPATERLAWVLQVQADACAAMGSPLYAHLLGSAAADARATGPVADALGDHLTPGRADALALRLMAALHRLVLTGEAPQLAAHYPSVGGDGDAAAAWSAMQELLASTPSRVTALLSRPLQTNEVGRCAALSWGLLEVAATTGLPLRLLEVGTSGGLLLRFDHYRYGGGGATWGPADSAVDLTGFWAEPPPAGTDVEVTVAERRGCDPAPVDVSTVEGRLALRSAVWADQLPRLSRLDGAVEIARRVPAELTQAPVATWLPHQLATPRSGVATVVFHSVVEEYLDDHQRETLHRTLASAGARASRQAPLVWLRLEPISRLRHHGVRVTTWPNGAPQERVVAVCGAHGTDVRRPPAA